MTVRIKGLPRELWRPPWWLNPPPHHTSQCIEWALVCPGGIPQGSSGPLLLPQGQGAQDPPTEPKTFEPGALRWKTYVLIICFCQFGGGNPLKVQFQVYTFEALQKFLPVFPPGDLPGEGLLTPSLAPHTKRFLTQFLLHKVLHRSFLLDLGPDFWSATNAGSTVG